MGKAGHNAGGVLHSALSAQRVSFEPEELEKCIANACIEHSVCSSPLSNLLFTP